jgi:hypothetical protein
MPREGVAEGSRGISLRGSRSSRALQELVRRAKKMPGLRDRSNLWGVGVGGRRWASGFLS